MKRLTLLASMQKMLRSKIARIVPRRIRKMNETTNVMDKELIQRRESIKGEYLHALMLKLRPQEPGDILPHAGQLAHAALLRWFAEVDSSLATYLHEPNVRRPFTCSSLWFPNTHEVIAAQRTNRH